MHDQPQCGITVNIPTDTRSGDFQQ